MYWVRCPVAAAIQILNEPHLDGPAKLIEFLPVDSASALLAGLHPDRCADIFRELSNEKRGRTPAPAR